MAVHYLNTAICFAGKSLYSFRTRVEVILATFPIINKWMKPSSVITGHYGSERFQLLQLYIPLRKPNIKPQPL